MKFVLSIVFLASLNCFAADVKITDLPLGTAAASGVNDVFPFVDTAAVVTKKMKLSDLKNLPSMTSTYAPKAFPTFTGTVTAPIFVGNLSGNASGSASTLSTTLGIALGGTGQTTKASAFDALSPLTTKGDLLCYTTLNARKAVGADGSILLADSTDACGFKWSSAGVGTVSSVSTGTGLTGGPITTTGTISLANTAVSPSTYGTATNVGSFTVDAQGRLTAASNIPIALDASAITTGALGVGFGGTGQTTYTNGQLLIGNTAGNTLAKSTLTAGNGIGITNGAGAITLAVSGAAGNSFQTSGTTFTTAATVTSTTQFKFTLIGGGGGGGGMATTNAKGAAGGAGASCIVYLTGLAASTGYTMAIGAAGAAGTSAPTAGGNGGNTTISINATTYTAGGGTGGAGTISTNGGAGGTCTNTTINISGQAGQGSVTAGTGSNGTSGGSSIFGMGGASVTVAGVGNSATGYGGGGGGASGNANAGGAGTQGAILVEWWN